MLGRGRALVVSLLLLGACRRASAGADNDCSGAAPSCYEPLAEGCCAEAGAPAECGPRDAPRGTRLKWVCPGSSTPASECRAYGPACASHPDQVAPTLATPHAVGAGDGPVMPSTWADAAAGTVLLDKTEQISAYYSVRTYTVKSSGFEGLSHRRDLYYGKERLGTEHFLAPGGEYVVYETGEGKNFLHSAVTGKKRSVTPKPYAPPDRVEWNMAKNSVTVLFEKGAPITVPLP